MKYVKHGVECTENAPYVFALDDFGGIRRGRDLVAAPSRHHELERSVQRFAQQIVENGASIDKSCHCCWLQLAHRMNTAFSSGGLHGPIGKNCMYMPGCAHGG